jgi:hypothetical protein
MTESTAPQFKVGDRVTIDHPSARKFGVCTIERFLPKNVMLRGENGRTVKADPSLLLPAPPEDGNGQPIGIPFEPFVIFSLGQTVTMQGREGVFVIIGDARGGDGYKVVKLGGDNDRYFPRVSPRHLTAVTLTYSIAEQPEQPA